MLIILESPSYPYCSYDITCNQERALGMGADDTTFVCTAHSVSALLHHSQRRSFSSPPTLLGWSTPCHVQHTTHWISPRALHSAKLLHCNQYATITEAQGWSRGTLTPVEILHSPSFVSTVNSLPHVQSFMWPHGARYACACLASLALVATATAKLTCWTVMASAAQEPRDMPEATAPKEKKATPPAVAVESEETLLRELVSSCTKFQ